MAKLYKVTTANLVLYKKPDNITDSNKSTVIKLGTQFYAEETSSGKSDDHWFVITKCIQYPDIVGKYAYRFIVANKNKDESQKNFMPVNGSDEDAGKERVTGTTEAIRDANGNPINYNSNGTVDNSSSDSSSSGSGGGNSNSSGDISDLYKLDDEFFTEYSANSSEESYMKNLQMGFDIQDLRGILGLPHQFLPTTDFRLDGTNNEYSIGRVYGEKILKNAPIMFITPGVPSFMAGYSKAQKATIVQQLIGVAKSDIDSLTSSYNGKYYSLKYAYVEYFNYVNPMLRSAALFLGIQNEKVNGKKLSTYNWLYDGSNGASARGSSGLAKFIGPYAGSIVFYADCGNQTSDSFSNNTTQSQLASTLNSLSDTGRELNFLVGNVGSLTGLKINKLTGEEDLMNNMENVQSAVNGVLGEGNIMSNILNKAQTILAGGRLVFPEIWSDSSFGRSYSCNMKLVSPSGDRLSVFLNILVPIYHLLGMCLPRQSIQQSYFSPFLLRCYYKGLFNVDMGIMTGLNITKGAECEWTVDGIPTVAEVSFEIKDLYEGFFMSRSESAMSHMSILSNITELDYIANSCGININDQEVYRTIKLWKILRMDNPIKDIVANGIFGNIAQFFNQKASDIFGKF